MKKSYTRSLILSLLVLAALHLTTQTHAQILWDGGGDGTSWNDANNWNPDMVPPADSLVVFSIDAVVTGTASVAPYRVNIAENTSVTLDLDLAVGNGVTNDHAVVLSTKSTLNFGAATPRNFTLNTSSGKQCLAIFAASDSCAINVAAGTTLTFLQGQLGINVANPTSSATVDGTLVFEPNMKNGIRSNGTFVNNGTIAFNENITDGLQVKEGLFENAPTGTINGSKAGDDLIEIFGGSTFRNFGTLNLVAQDSAGTGNNCIYIGTDVDPGTFINEAGGVVNADGGDKDSGRAISVDIMGVLQNYGTITFTGGNIGARLFNRGATTNEMNAVMNLTDGRINVSEGTFGNDGLLLTTKEDGPGVFNTGTATNNGFYQYGLASAFASGTGTFTDDGIDLMDTLRFQIDAGGTCLVDIAQMPYEWYEGINLVGVADANGLLTLPDESLTADPATLTTTLEGVSITVYNFCPTALKPSSVFSPNTEARGLRLFPTLLRQQEMLTVDLSGLDAVPVAFDLIDLTGKTVQSFTLQGGALSTVQVEALQPGLYLLTSYHQQIRLSGRLVILP